MRSFLTFITGIIIFMAFSAQVSGEMAKKERKPIFVDFFYGKGCPRCEKTEE